MCQTLLLIFRIYQQGKTIKTFLFENKCTQADCFLYSCHDRIPLDEEKGDFSGKNNKEFRNESELEKPRVMWDVERRCYLDSGAKTE